MATKTEEPHAPILREASSQCRRAIEDCETLLKRTEEMLQRSQRDNNRRYTN